MEKKFEYAGKTISVENPPKCHICGHEFDYVEKRKNVFRITTCSNPECIAHNNNSTNTRVLSLFGEDVLKNKIENRKKKSPVCVEYWLEKGFSKEDAIEKVKERQSYSSKFVKNRGKCSKKLLLSKMTEEEANLFLRKKSRYCIEYWTSRGYTEEEGKKEISKIQHNYSKISNKDIEKIKQRSWRCPEYWMKISGCTLEEAKKIISEKQVFFSKEKCIEKYGEEEGLKKWEERQQKWQSTLHKSEKLHVGFSKVSQELFDKILSFYDEKEKDYVFYGRKNHEYCIRKDNVNYIYDFTDLNKRKIIEFQGDIYHANPLIFEETDTPNPFKKNKTSKDLWEFDEKKKKIAVDNGFSYLAIWENDYRNNKEKVTQEILKFLKIC